MSWTLELSYGDKHGSVSLPSWSATRDKIAVALVRFEPNEDKRRILIARLDESDAARNQFFVMSNGTWKIAAQVELNPTPWVPGEPVREKEPV